MSVTRTVLLDMENFGPLTVFDGNILVGLDCETSTKSLENGGRLIQYGVCFFDGIDSFVSASEYVRWDYMAWDYEAESIHKIARESLSNKRYSGEVDDDLYAIISPIKDKGLNLIATGYNVGSFDLPFFRHAFPKTMSLFSHRVMDMNSLCYLLDSINPLSRSSINGSFKSLTKEFSKGRIQSLPDFTEAHDAGYDATEAILSVAYIQNYLKTYLDR